MKIANDRNKTEVGSTEVEKVSIDMRTASTTKLTDEVKNFVGFLVMIANEKLPLDFMVFFVILETVMVSGEG
jgi:hypothetical protein